MLTPDPRSFLPQSESIWSSADFPKRVRLRSFAWSIPGCPGTWCSNSRFNRSGAQRGCGRTTGRVPVGNCSPRGPTEPHVRSRAYGSSDHELATRRLSEWIIAPPRTRPCDRCRFVSTVLGFDAPAMWPSNGVMTWRPLLSTGSLGMVPPLRRYYGTLRLPAVLLDPLDDSRADTIVSPVVCSPRPGASHRGPGSCRFRSPHPELRWERRGLSGSLETLVVIVRALRPRQDQAG